MNSKVMCDQLKKKEGTVKKGEINNKVGTVNVYKTVIKCVEFVTK